MLSSAQTLLSTATVLILPWEGKKTIWNVGAASEFDRKGKFENYFGNLAHDRDHGYVHEEIKVENYMNQFRFTIYIHPFKFQTIKLPLSLMKKT